MELFRAATVATYYRLAEILGTIDRAATSEIIVSGGVLKSPPALRILADALGRDLRVVENWKARFAAPLHALSMLEFSPKPLPAGKLVRYDPALAALHRSRRQPQCELERRLR